MLFIIHLALSCPGTATPIVIVGHSTLKPGSEELFNSCSSGRVCRDDVVSVYEECQSHMASVHMHDMCIRITGTIYC